MALNVRYIISALVLILILISLVLVAWMTYTVNSITFPNQGTKSAADYAVELAAAVDPIKNNLKYNYGSIVLHVFALLMSAFLMYK